MGESGRERKRAVGGRRAWFVAVWAAVVLLVGGGAVVVEAGAPASALAPCTAPAWNAESTYSQGAEVSHKGHQWRANTWLWAGVEPGVSGAPPWWIPWHDLGPCQNGGTTSTTSTTSSTSSTTSTTVPGAITPPGQPTSGPGGSNYPHGDWSVSAGGSGNDAWFVFQPTSPRPASAPVAVMLHGYGEYAGYDSMYGFIRHTVRKGYVVVYPRWQTGLFEPGPSIEATMTSAKNGIAGGLAWLQADRANRVQPQLDKVGYFGFSWSGIITANLANRHASLGLPAPKSVMLYEPFGGVLGDPFDATMTGIPSTTKLVCMVAEGMGVDRSCGTLFPKLGHISPANKDFVTLYSDTYGAPDLVANHQSVCSPPPVPGPPTAACDPNGPDVTTNAVDWFGFWKPWVALQSCANSGSACADGINNTPEHRDMGRWSDGTPVRPLRILDAPAPP